jgi:hypothetical protein
LLSLGSYFVDILIVYLEKHYDDISIQDILWEGVEVGQLFESYGISGKTKQENWPQ